MKTEWLVVAVASLAMGTGVASPNIEKPISNECDIQSTSSAPSQNYSEAPSEVSFVGNLDSLEALLVEKLAISKEQSTSIALAQNDPEAPSEASVVNELDSLEALLAETWNKDDPNPNQISVWGYQSAFKCSKVIHLTFNDVHGAANWFPLVDVLYPGEGRISLVAKYPKLASCLLTPPFIPQHLSTEVKKKYMEPIADILGYLLSNMEEIAPAELFRDDLISEMIQGTVNFGGIRRLTSALIRRGHVQLLKDYFLDSPYSWDLRHLLYSYQDIVNSVDPPAAIEFLKLLDEAYVTSGHFYHFLLHTAAKNNNVGFIRFLVNKSGLSASKALNFRTTFHYKTSLELLLPQLTTEVLSELKTVEASAIGVLSLILANRLDLLSNEALRMNIDKRRWSILVIAAHIFERHEILEFLKTLVGVTRTDEIIKDFETALAIDGDWELVFFFLAIDYSGNVTSYGLKTDDPLRRMIYEQILEHLRKLIDAADPPNNTISHFKTQAQKLLGCIADDYCTPPCNDVTRLDWILSWYKKYQIPFPLMSASRLSFSTFPYAQLQWYERALNRNIFSINDEFLNKPSDLYGSDAAYTEFLYDHGYPVPTVPIVKADSSDACRLYASYYPNVVPDECLCLFIKENSIDNLHKVAILDRRTSSSLKCEDFLLNPLDMSVYRAAHELTGWTPSKIVPFSKTTSLWIKIPAGDSSFFGQLNLAYYDLLEWGIQINPDIDIRDAVSEFISEGSFLLLQLSHQYRPEVVCGVVVDKYLMSGSLKMFGMLDRLPTLGPAVFASITQSDYSLLSADDREQLYTQYMNKREKLSGLPVGPSSAKTKHNEIVDALVRKCSPESCKWLLELE